MTHRISDENFKNIRDVMEFAFQNGYHELGYDPLASIEAELNRLRGLENQLRPLAERMEVWEPTKCGEYDPSRNIPTDISGNSK